MKLSLGKTLMSLAIMSFLAIGSAQAAPTVKFNNLRTDVTLDSTFVSALTDLGVAVAPVSGARIISGQARFPITAAELDLSNAAGEIIHKGGLKLSAGSTVVELTSFIIDTTSTPVITGLVKANGSIVGRINLFDLTLPTLTLPLARAKTVTIPDVAVVLSSDAAAALNSAFGVTAFAQGLAIGTGHVILKR